MLGHSYGGRAVEHVIDQPGGCPLMNTDEGAITQQDQAWMRRGAQSRSTLCDVLVMRERQLHAGGSTADSTREG
jgi:hypothetical protein